MKYGLVITAAGTSTRFGANKLFSDLNGKPLIVRTCEAFLCFSQISEWVLVLNPESKKEWQKWTQSHPFPKDIKYVEGSSSRQKSVRNGVMAVSSSIDKVLIHDAARPYISQALIDRLLAKSMQSSAVIPGIPVVDTIKQIGQQKVLKTLDRESLIAVQTPQVFDRKNLLEAYKKCDMTQIYTDEASLIESVGGVVDIVDGEIENIKVTFPTDLA